MESFRLSDSFCQAIFTQRVAIAELSVLKFKVKAASDQSYLAEEAETT